MTGPRTIALAFQLLAWFYLQDFTSAQACSLSRGPAGGIHCICRDRYDACQWSTCLSNRYIQQKSNHRHICQLSGALYCNYQCMLEEYNVNRGPVYDKCRCTVGESIPTIAPSGDINSNDLDPDCASPDGTSCTWYRDCLEKKFNCEDSGNGYALTFAEKICDLYDQRRQHFTARGQQWVNAVRKCLQVALVPLIRPWETPSCAQIKRRAFDSHTPCYLNPEQNAPSMCDLNCYDWAQVVWTIKGGFADAFVESLKGAVGVMLGCGKNLELLSSGCPSVVLKLGLVYIRLRRKRDVSDPDLRDRIAGDVAEKLSVELGWDPMEIDWFAYAPNITEGETNAGEIQINVLLGDKTALRLNNYSDSNITPKSSLRDVVDTFSDALKKGHLYDLQLEGGEATVSTLDACRNMQCTETVVQTEAGPKAEIPNPYRRKNLATTAHPENLLVWLGIGMAAYFGCFNVY